MWLRKQEHLNNSQASVGLKAPRVKMPLNLWESEM